MGRIVAALYERRCGRDVLVHGPATVADRRYSAARASPADGGCGPGQTGPKDDQHDVLATLEGAAAVGFVKGDGNRRCGGVAVFVEIDEDPFVRHGKAVGDGVDDAQIRLMRDDAGDVFRMQAGALDDFFSGLLHARHGMLEDFLALHFEGEEMVIDVAGGDRAGGAATGNLEQMS